MKRIFYSLLIIVLASCNSDQKLGQSNDSLRSDSMNAVMKSDTSQSEKPIEEGTKWQYTEDEDKMTSKKKYFATIDANELLELKFPYDGGVTASLIIRYKDKENDAMLTVTKGQFMSNVVDGESIRIRFDDKQPTTFECSSPSDGSSNVLFIHPSTKLISKLKTAKKAIIQAEFYDNGLQIMEFDVSGFKWEH